MCTGPPASLRSPWPSTMLRLETTHSRLSGNSRHHQTTRNTYRDVTGLEISWQDELFLKCCVTVEYCVLYSCGMSWYDGEWSQGCPECGEGAMQLPCPICKGRCGRVWRRDVELVSQCIFYQQLNYLSMQCMTVCVCVHRVTVCRVLTGTESVDTRRQLPC